MNPVGDLLCKSTAAPHNTHMLMLEPLRTADLAVSKRFVTCPFA